MIVQSLLGEFKQEAESTRKLLNAIPDSALDWKPSETSWTMGQLASHIAEIYNWYEGVFKMDVFDMAAYKYYKGDISTAAGIIAKFEENVKKAQACLEEAKEEDIMTPWKMTMGSDEPVFPVMPRAIVARGFLMNHLYHHRGEMIAHLRATGNKVPSLYGPNYEDSQRAQ